MSDCNHNALESCLRGDECAECLREKAKANLIQQLGSAVPFAVLFFDPEAPTDFEFSVRLTDVAVGALATLTDFDLKVMAAEAGLRMRRALEMPPSPHTEG